MKSLEGLPAWPACLTEAEALVYTRVSVAQMRFWRDRGLVKFINRGRNGAAIARRANLDAALADLFEARGGSGTEDWFEDEVIEF